MTYYSKFFMNAAAAAKSLFSKDILILDIQKVLHLKKFLREEK